MRFSLRRLFVSDTEQRAVNDGVYQDLNQLAQFFSAGNGAPTHTPAGPELYFQLDGPAVYRYNGAWAAV